VFLGTRFLAGFFEFVYTAIRCDHISTRCESGFKKQECMHIAECVFGALAIAANQSLVSAFIVPTLFAVTSTLETLAHAGTRIIV